MNIVYNDYYKQNDYFGKPYSGLVNFFKAYPKRNRILDLGCGQGRDALFLGRLGYQVTGIDISDVGIKQMNNIAQIEDLKVKGIVADIYSYKISDEYDAVLLDSIIHFYKNDLVKEKKLLKKIIYELKSGGMLCNFMQKGAKREKVLKRTIQETGKPYDVIIDDYTVYPEHNLEFHMYIVKKL